MNYTRHRLASLTALISVCVISDKDSVMFVDTLAKICYGKHYRIYSTNHFLFEVISQAKHEKQIKITVFIKLLTIPIGHLNDLFPTKEQYGYTNYPCDNHMIIKFHKNTFKNLQICRCPFWQYWPDDFQKGGLWQNLEENRNMNDHFRAHWLRKSFCTRFRTKNRNTCFGG